MKDVLEIKYDPQTSKEMKENHDNWWTLSDKDMHESLWASIDNITSLEHRRRVNTRNAILYEDIFDGRQLTGYPYNFGKVPRYTSRIGYNVVKSVIDTVVSKITKNKPKVQFLTDGGNFKQRNKAKNLTKYVNASFRNMGFYTHNGKSFRDGTVFGTGFTKFYKDVEHKRIRCERVVTDEIIVDDGDGMYGTPKNLYQVRYVNRWLLKEQWPDHAEAIDAATPISLTTLGTNDLIEIAEGWHLGHTEDRKDGRHVIVIKQATLFEEPYTEDYFPFVVNRWTEPLYGYWGLGIPDELLNIQQEIDRILRNISRALNLIAVPRIWLPNSAEIDPQEITNEVGQIIKYNASTADSKPHFATPTAMNAETYNHLKWLIQSAYEKTGVSQLSAQSAKPAGLNAAVAIRTVQDIETERFFSIADSYQTSHLDAAKIIVSLSRSLHKDLIDKKDKKGLVVKGMTDNEMEEINWKDCDLDEERYVMEAWPINMLPDRPEGKMQFISELIEAQILSPDKAPKLLPYPDIQAELETEFAPTMLIDKILNNILYEGKYQQPEPNFELNYAMLTAPKFYNQGKLENVPEENLMKILLFIDDVERLLTKTKEVEQPLPENANPLADEASAELAALSVPDPTITNQVADQGLINPEQMLPPEGELPI